MSLSLALLNKVCELAAILPPPVLAQVAALLRSACGQKTHDAALREILPILHADNRGPFQELMTAWRRETPQLSGAEFCAALEGAAHQEHLLKAKASIELVWTGPTFPSSGLRNTEQVLLDLIQAAREYLYVVTFAAYKVPSLIEALRAAAARGVRIAFILEDKEESGGKVIISPMDALQALGSHGTKVYTWPLDMRPRNKKGQYGSLHAKFIVVDGTRLFVSSANLTEYALSLNMEMGVLVSGGEVPRQAIANIQALIREGVLREMSGGTT